jgi:hypothetical protein
MELIDLSKEFSHELAESREGQRIPIEWQEMNAGPPLSARQASPEESPQELFSAISPSITFMVTSSS